MEDQTMKGTEGIPALTPLNCLVTPSREIATRLRQPSPQEIQDTRLRLGLTPDVR